MNYGLLAFDALKQVFNIFCRVSVTEHTCSRVNFNQISDWLDCTSLIQLQGSSVYYLLSVSADLGFLKEAYLRMFSETVYEVSPETADLLGEICNQVAGKIKTTLSSENHTFDMASPVVVIGQNVKVRNLSEIEGELFELMFDFGRAFFFVHWKELKKP
ncbi:MAG: chemotaxis protein CheX [Deltaproteobacteria bacterium]|nr:chemotaxis protein CheX [Deltaproteobacteria bacterium]MCX7952236.1 chemotaxis protein CheX [Deltaproteobacteria bacterium]